MNRRAFFGLTVGALAAAVVPKQPAAAAFGAEEFSARFFSNNARLRRADVARIFNVPAHLLEHAPR